MSLLPAEVGLTHTGKLFHRTRLNTFAVVPYPVTDCHFGWVVKERISVEEAARRGLAPCSKCFYFGAADDYWKRFPEASARYE